MRTNGYKMSRNVRLNGIKIAYKKGTTEIDRRKENSEYNHQLVSNLIWIQIIPMTMVKRDCDWVYKKVSPLRKEKMNPDYIRNLFVFFSLTNADIKWQNLGDLKLLIRRMRLMLLIGWCNEEVGERIMDGRKFMFKHVWHLTGNSIENQYNFGQDSRHFRRRL
jgi:hypothetical protein